MPHINVCWGKYILKGLCFFSRLASLLYLCAVVVVVLLLAVVVRKMIGTKIVPFIEMRPYNFIKCISASGGIVVAVV